ncbi:endo-1,3-1,4-beta-glycanase ExoK [Pseudorhizobium tarimense]|uniref:Endo-1,3-1,4-beta-glycanase ExoK n=1 Tax=Pseudorhizobium tarimense TaxID=1079109 RepID=A0ABV2H0S6_9HYPH|nr:glycoside hydrolase family 16 protein [Pseudorhizobium tarimense]MCJ8517470.1 glycoside hydrolase family 16 protein [Pseudorhizobium tarimense]
MKTTSPAAKHTLTAPLIALALIASGSSAVAQTGTGGGSFVEEFDRLDTSRWYVSDGWSNGSHQNCTWSKRQVQIENGTLQLGFEAAEAGDRKFACGEIQTRARYGHGTYEVRMKAGEGSGRNSAFFTYIGPTDKKPHDEIDFEVLGKNLDQVQLNQYVSGKGGNEKLVSLEESADEVFNDFAFMWEEGRLRYFVNGELVHEVTDASKIPSNPQKIFLSFWGSDNLKNWMGPFSYEGPRTMEVERVAFTAQGDVCQFPESLLCKLD